MLTHKSHSTHTHMAVIQYDKAWTSYHVCDGWSATHWCMRICERTCVTCHRFCFVQYGLVSPLHMNAGKLECVEFCHRFWIVYIKCFDNLVVEKFCTVFFLQILLIMNWSDSFFSDPDMYANQFVHIKLVKSLIILY